MSKRANPAETLTEKIFLSGLGLLLATTITGCATPAAEPEAATGQQGGIVRLKADRDTEARWGERRTGIDVQRQIVAGGDDADRDHGTVSPWWATSALPKARRPGLAPRRVVQMPTQTGGGTRVESFRPPRTPLREPTAAELEQQLGDMSFSNRWDSAPEEGARRRGPVEVIAPQMDEMAAADVTQRRDGAVAVAPARPVGADMVLSAPPLMTPRDTAPAQVETPVADPKAATPSAPPADAMVSDTAATPWGIVLNTFKGDTARQSAATMIQSVPQVAPGVGQLRVHEHDGAAMVVYGEYTGPGDARARNDLQRIKAIEFQGHRVFAKAMLAPLKSDQQRIHQWDVQAMRVLYPGVSELYTLDIAVWSDFGDPAWTAERVRRSAEQYCAQLRQQNVPAWFSHNTVTNTSSVTVGVFGKDALDASSGMLSPEVMQWMRRFPERTVNGEPFKEVNRQGEAVAQPPLLVEVPR